jgi:hypothetical protein
MAILWTLLHNTPYEYVICEIYGFRSDKDLECGLASGKPHFGWVKTGAPGSSEVLEANYKTIRCHNPYMLLVSLYSVSGCQGYL